MVRSFFRAGSVAGLVLLLFVARTGLAISPPSHGPFPAGFWERIHRDHSLRVDEGSGWARRFAARRAAQLERARDKADGHAIPRDTYHLPVLLGSYSDRAGVIPPEDFQEMLFGSIPTGSMSEYYDEVSYGQFTVTGEVYGWFTAPEAQAYYGCGDNGFCPCDQFPANRAGFIYHILQEADPTVDFSQYDNDGPDDIPNSGDDDGYVDGVFLVFPGASAEWGPGNNGNLWSSMGGLCSDYTTNDASASGGMIKVNWNAITSEQAGNGDGNGSIRPIGVFAHEFGHLLALPDQYDRTDDSDPPDNNRSNGLGNWCLMASGSWGCNNTSTQTPCHPCAWCKIQLGWLAPTVVTESVAGLEIPQVETNPSAYLLWEDPHEWSRYFLLENRQRVGFDSNLHGPGLMIYHVDENRRWGRWSFSAGPCNDDETHKLVDIEGADGRRDLDVPNNRGDAADPFPGTSNNRDFSSSTNPNSRDYENLPTGVEVLNISDSAAVMTADVTARELGGYAIAYDELGVTGWGWGYGDPQDSWGGVRFTAVEDGVLEAVDVGFRGDTPYQYVVSVHASLSINPDETAVVGQLLARMSGSVSQSGWYTIPVVPGVSGPVVVEAGQDFFVTLKIEDKSYAIPFDKFGDTTRRSYFSSNGVNFYPDIGIDGGDINLRVRIRNLSSQWFRRGDVDGDGLQTINDAVLALHLVDAPETPTCLDASDFNDDGLFDEADATAWLDWKYRGDFRPAYGGQEECGPDLESDDLGCEEYSICDEPTTSVPDPDLRYSIQIDGVEPDTVVRAHPGSTLRLEGSIVLSASRGDVAGWSLSLAGEGPELTFEVAPPPDEEMPCDPESEAGAPCCARAILGEEADGSEVHFCAPVVVNPLRRPRTGPLAGTGRQGAGIVDAVALRTDPEFTLDAGEHTLLRFAVSLEVPFTTEPDDVVLSFRDGLQGLGEYVTNDISVGQTLHRPEVEDLHFQLASIFDFRRGDSNLDRKVDMSDGILTLSHLFLGQGDLRCRHAADANDDGGIDMSDAITTFGFLFLGNAFIPFPGPFVCGLDETPDDLECEEYTCASEEE